ncbi:hypothetical protein KC19_3G259600 [Ceratodon purpureus]|uniref:allene-oxide cyclase n=1 Tax=Ceratodon purpureus TaxID=3225 RepID=A0A8T0IQ23_CERPU|nr:hypothetical protein KC19_3G259600 [Ceratodon purpureus]
MATMAAVTAAAPAMALGGVGGLVRLDSETRLVVNGLRGGVRDRGVRCVANSAAGQRAVEVQKVPAAAGMASQRGNKADELLERWAKQPASASGRGSETEAVRRLFMWDSLPKKEEVQLFSVYEINEHDRDSPAFLPFSTINISKPRINTSFLSGLSNLFTTLSGDHEHGLGDLVPFTNKIYDSTLRVRLGVTAGMTMVVKAYPGQGQKHHKKQKLFFPDRYEATYTFYLGDMGHVSAQGPFSSFEDTLLTITGGAGLFREAKGVIHLHNITPFKLFYTFHVRGVPELPKILTASPVEPNEFVQPCREAAACKAGFTLPNYTD